MSKRAPKLFESSWIAKIAPRNQTIVFVFVFALSLKLNRAELPDSLSTWPRCLGRDKQTTKLATLAETLFYFFTFRFISSLFKKKTLIVFFSNHIRFFLIKVKS